MTALNKQALREAAEKATQGEWWSDVVETDGEYGEGEDRASGYHSYAVYVGSESLLDMTNSTAACIHEEWDHDYHMAWDETAKRNAEFIAAANPATVLALLDELEAAQKLATQQGNIAVALLDEVTMLRRNANDNAPELRECLEAAERRIAELEAKLANPVLLPKTNGYWNEQEKAYEEAITLARRQIRLAGFRCEGDE
ncbi:ead/Ea22-like family protein [Citrobacter freundii]